ncbi:hypothetical protein CVT24_011288 [Panaeolus cyanescens]|uniref:Extracellular membrane protein CFEM domain-containing protein n=1 Tax=Panaeolus cyanescens TaxID=181874 RepID=A0A409YUZ6_9AGAR|nr:hypothetical protein CVT24_011288 [Panaeolus cyanescens]
MVMTRSSVIFVAALAASWSSTAFKLSERQGESCLSDCAIDASRATMGDCGQLAGPQWNACQCRSRYIVIVANCFRAQCSPDSLSAAYSAQEGICRDAGVPVDLRSQGVQPAPSPLSPPPPPVPPAIPNIPVTTSNRNTPLSAQSTARSPPTFSVSSTITPTTGGPHLAASPTNPPVSDSIQISSTIQTITHFTTSINTATPFWSSTPTSNNSSTAEAPTITGKVPPFQNRKTPSHVGAIIGAIISILVVMALVFVMLYRRNRRQKKLNQLLASPFVPSPTTHIGIADAVIAKRTEACRCALEVQAQLVSSPPQCVISKDLAKKEKLNEAVPKPLFASKEPGAMLSAKLAGMPHDEDLQARARRLIRRSCFDDCTATAVAATILRNECQTSPDTDHCLPDQVAATIERQEYICGLSHISVDLRSIQPATDFPPPRSATTPPQSQPTDVPPHTTTQSPSLTLPSITGSSVLPPAVASQVSDSTPSGSISTTPLTSAGATSNAPAPTLSTNTIVTSSAAEITHNTSLFSSGNTALFPVVTFMGSPNEGGQGKQIGSHIGIIVGCTMALLGSVACILFLVGYLRRRRWRSIQKISGMPFTDANTTGGINIAGGGLIPVGFDLKVEVIRVDHGNDAKNPNAGMNPAPGPPDPIGTKQRPPGLVAGRGHGPNQIDFDLAPRDDRPPSYRTAR